MKMGKHLPYHRENVIDWQTSLLRRKEVHNATPTNTPWYMGCIYLNRTPRLPDGRVRVRVKYCRHDGGRGETHTRAKNTRAGERTLLAKFPKLLAEVTEPQPEQAPETFSSLVPEWLAEERTRFEQGEIARGTYAEHKRLLLTTVEPALTDRTLTDITPRTVNIAYKRWVARWPPQARLAKGILNQVLAYATATGYIDRNTAGQ